MHSLSNIFFQKKIFLNVYKMHSSCVLSRKQSDKSLQDLAVSQESKTRAPQAGREPLLSSLVNPHTRGKQGTKAKLLAPQNTPNTA